MKNHHKVQVDIVCFLIKIKADIVVPLGYTRLATAALAELLNKT